MGQIVKSDNECKGTDIYSLRTPRLSASKSYGAECVCVCGIWSVELRLETVLLVVNTCTIPTPGASNRYLQRSRVCPSVCVCVTNEEPREYRVSIRDDSVLGILSSLVGIDNKRVDYFTQSREWLIDGTSFLYERECVRVIQWLWLHTYAYVPSVCHQWRQKRWHAQSRPSQPNVCERQYSETCQQQCQSADRLHDSVGRRKRWGIIDPFTFCLCLSMVIGPTCICICLSTCRPAFVGVSRHVKQSISSVSIYLSDNSLAVSWLLCQ